MRSPAPSDATGRVLHAGTAIWLVATFTLFLIVARGIERRVTWYLAVDQYGYLSFAQDLTRGRVFRSWPPLDALGPRLPDRIDVLAQTYIWDEGRLYCRYAPGYSILLAGWMRLFGTDAAHAFNPTVLLALLAVALAFQRRVFDSRWLATAGTALVILFPTYLHIWALTPVRDLSAHLSGLLGLFLLLPPGDRALRGGRTTAAGLALGYAAAIRPDALIYLGPALAVATLRWRRERTPRDLVARALGTGALGVLLGMAPLLAYNWMATGNPLRPTQAMELESFLPTPTQPEAGSDGVGYPPGAWRGGTKYGIQGGGLRLAHFPRTLPGNVQLLRNAYGDVILTIALLGAALALVQRRLLFITAVPYTVLALVVFSFWSRPDQRYLAGIYLFVPMLVVEGTAGGADLLRRLARRVATPARGVALALAVALVAAAWASDPAPTGALPALTLLVPLTAATTLLGVALVPWRRLAVIAPALALALVVLAGWRAIQSTAPRARFQRPAMETARATLTSVVRPGAVIITDEGVGRPAENIDYYSGVANALYLTDLQRWRISVRDAAYLLLRAQMVPYLLLPMDEGRDHRLAVDLAKHLAVERIALVPPERAVDFFVAASFHRGVGMALYEVRRRWPRPGKTRAGVP